MQALGSVVGIAPPNEKDYVKRVIAVGGQTVMCCDAEGNVMVDGTSAGRALHLRADRVHPGRAGLQHDAQMSRRCFGPVTDPGGRAVGDGRSPFGLGRLVLPVPGPCRPARARSARGRSRSTTSSARRSFIVMPPSRWGTIGNPDIVMARTISRSPTVTLRVRRPHLRVEKELLRTGTTRLAAMDEVGRGALAGPVTVGRRGGHRADRPGARRGCATPSCSPRRPGRRW